MIDSFIGKKVKVYWNLHKQCWSVIYKTKVVGYVYSIRLENVHFVVQKAGRQRVLQEKKKNVHAFVVGTLIAFNQQKPPDYVLKISYHPYLNPWFHLILSPEEKIDECNFVHCEDKIVYGKNING